MPNVTIARRELYDQVWSKPLLRLAKEYGLSDVGLAKVCRRLNIPRPPGGYWAKLQSGQRLKQTPLPNPDDDRKVTMSIPSERETTDSALAGAVHKAACEERQKGSKIAVAQTLRACHELVSQTNQELQGVEKDDHGLLVKPKDLPLDVQVSRAQLRRALLIMDALIKALEQRG